MTGLAEIRRAIAELSPADWREIRRWMDAHPPGAAADSSAPPVKRPDFLGRQNALFGERVLPDSQVVLDDLRAERV